MNPQRRAFAARFTGLALAALAPMSTLAADAPQALAPMVVFDAAFIPALATTGSAGASPAAAQRARTATAALRDRWPELKAALEAQPPSAATRAAWSKALAETGRRIAKAAEFAERAAWPASHEALEDVRTDLMDVRRGAGFDYYVDRLTAFHEPMEVIATAGANWVPSDLSAARRAELERAFAEAGALWREVERHPADPAAYRLTTAREAQWRKALADEAAALSRLSDALRSSDAVALLKAAAAIKPPYARAFTAFGAAEGEAALR